MCRSLCEIEDGRVDSFGRKRLRDSLTVDGHSEEVVVSTEQIGDSRLVAAEIGRDGDHVLVELPRESSSGRWRVWVNQNQVG